MSVVRSTCFVLALLFAAAATAQGKPPRLCFLTFDPTSSKFTRFKSFFDALRGLGYSQPKTLVVEMASAEEDNARFPALAAQCARNKADVIVVTTTPAALAAKGATSTIPIVLHPVGDPVATGLVKSLAAPGGNITGLSFMAPGLAAKRLELLAELVPGIQRVLVLTYLTDPIARPQVEEMQKAAASRGIRLIVQDIRRAEDYEPAFREGEKQRAQGLLVTSESISYVHRSRIAALAAKARLPAVYWRSEFADAGGLLAYSSNSEELTARTAVYVDRVLKGAKPADMPIEQPTRFIMTVNMRVAKAAAITIPQAIALRADRLID